MLARLNHSRRQTWVQWSGLVFWAMLGALMLQCFTIDGAPLFEPFSNHRVVLGSFIIVDPLYAMPLLAGLLVALYLARGSRERAFASLAGMGFSMLYLIVTLFNQWQVHSVFQHSLQTQGHDYQQLFIYPMAFNNVRWLGMAEDDRGVWVGYYSTQDDFEYVAFQHVDKNERLIAELMEETAAQRLLGLFGARHAPSETPGVITDDELSMPPVQKGSRLVRPERAKEDLS
jgi:inner membrane protein